MQELMNFTNQIIKENKSMDSLIIYKNGSGYIVNEKSDEKINIRSISKTILALTCGIIIDEDINFDEESKIFSILYDKIDITNKNNDKYLKVIKIKHLLTHTVGYRDVLLMSRNINKYDKDNLLDYLINYPIHYKPGTYFLYSNASYYLLSATLEEYLGYELFDYINKRLFKPLEIKNARADMYGKYLAGATKFYLSAEDLLKIGKLILNKGVYNGKRIVSESWINKMIAPYFKNELEDKNKSLSEDYYGYSLWSSESGEVFASGTGGQLIVFLQKLGTIIVTTNNGSANKAYRIKNDVAMILDMLNRRYYGL